LALPGTELTPYRGANAARFAAAAAHGCANLALRLRPAFRGFIVTAWYDLPGVARCPGRGMFPARQRAYLPDATLS
jgi:hypothetical protein